MLTADLESGFMSPLNIEVEHSKNKNNKKNNNNMYWEPTQYRELG